MNDERSGRYLASPARREDGTWYCWKCEELGRECSPCRRAREQLQHFSEPAKQSTATHYTRRRLSPVARTVAAVDGAVQEVLQEGWALDSRLTKVTVRLTGALTLAATTLVWPIDLLWSIPRALLSVIPVVKFLYLIPMFILFFVLSAPVTGTSWLWREMPFLRGILIPIGIPFAVVGIAFTQLAFMGGPTRDGVLKAWRKAAFETWPLTLDVSDKASLEAAVLAY